MLLSVATSLQEVAYVNCPLRQVDDFLAAIERESTHLSQATVSQRNCDQLKWLVAGSAESANCVLVVASVMILNSGWCLNEASGAALYLKVDALEVGITTEREERSSQRRPSEIWLRGWLDVHTM
jgi:hypothetical protein